MTKKEYTLRDASKFIFLGFNRHKNKVALRYNINGKNTTMFLKPADANELGTGLIHNSNEIRGHTSDYIKSKGIESWKLQFTPSNV